MAAPVDLTGQEFNGHLVVSRHRESDRTFYTMKCSCGCIFYTRAEHVKTTLGCKACRYLKIKPKGVKEDLSGKKYNRLTVIRLSHFKGSHSIWECQCDCGKVLYVMRGNLVKGHTKSCGCFRKEKGKTIKIPNVNSAFTEIYRTYKQGAVKRNLEFNLVKEQALAIFTQNCHYCNQSPSNTSRTKIKEFRYSGIDRIDNDKGYSVDNCVPCCKTCNRMKSNLTLEEFKSRILILYRKFYES